MLHLLGLVVSIGLADSLNPSSIGPALYLAAGERPRRSVVQFAVGYGAVTLIGGLVLTLGPGRAILALVPTPSLTTRYILETAAGVAMLVVAVVLWRRHEELGGDDEDGGSSARSGRPLLMGVTISAVELPTAFPYFAVIAAIVGSGLSVTNQILLVVIYNLCFVSPLLAIVVTLALAGDRAIELLTRARDFLHKHWPALVAAIALVAGLFVTVLGVTGLGQKAGGHVGHISRRIRRLITHPGG